jgi:hypothetical protein
MRQVFIALLLVMFFASVSMADFSQNNDGATILCGADNTLTISLSPQVTAGYTCLDNNGDADWYVIGTYHVGGTKVYATASSLTKIFNSTSDADTTLSAIFSSVPQTVSAVESDDQWSTDLGWSAM